jgi:hypothetical protein
VEHAKWSLCCDEEKIAGLVSLFAGYLNGEIDKSRCARLFLHLGYDMGSLGELCSQMA